MANGVSFDISIDARSNGVEDATAQLLTLAQKLTGADTAATQLDRAVDMVGGRLAAAASAAASAAAAVGSAQAQYNALESAANRSAKSLERATAAGKDTTELAAAAAAARGAMSAQASVVDDLRAKSQSAAAAQKDLADTLGTLKTAQAAEAAAIKKRTTAQAASTQGTELSIAAYITIARQIYRVARAVYDAGKAFAEFLIGTNPAAVAKLNSAYAKMTANFKALFTGLKFDKLVDGLTNTMSIFDKGTSSARGLKTLVEYMFQPLIDGAAAAMPYIKAFLTGMIHGALLVVIAILKIRNAIFEAMSPETRAYIKKLVDHVFTLQNAFEAGKYVAIALAVAVGALAAVFLACGFALAILVAPIIAVVALIQNWDKVLLFLCDTWNGLSTILKVVIGALLVMASPILLIAGLVTALGAGIYELGKIIVGLVSKAVDWGKSLAANIIAGLTGGLAEGTSGAAGAMDKMVSTMNAAAKARLDAHSPSRVYERLGGYVAEGMALGIEGGTGDVHDAVEDMAAPPSSATSGGGTVGGARTIHFSGPITIGDSPVAQENLAKFKAMLLETLEGASLAIGGGEVPA